MSKKVYELANELGIGAVDLVEKLRSIGLNVRNHMVALADDELEKAQKELGLSADGTPDKASASKVTKKKVAKKKVAKKKTVKKVIRKSSDSSEEAKEDAQAAPAEADTKVVTVKRKTKASEDDQREVATAENEATAGTVEAKKDAPLEETTSKVIKKKVVKKSAAKAKASEDAQDSDDKELYKEKMHSFTPIYVPEEGEEDKDVVAKKKSFTNSEATTSEDSEDSDDSDAKGKKRIGNLAAMVNKKGAAAKSKDITMLRAEEELKFASGVVGSAAYSPAKKKKIYSGPSKQTEITEVKDSKRFVVIHDAILARELAQKLSQKFQNFANECLKLNLLVKEDDYLGEKLATQIAELYDYRIENRAFDEAEVLGSTSSKDKSDLPLRDPIITIMGHVDHGKTTLLDYIRNAKVADGEAGGITQHIGAYSVKVDSANLTFLDTPGHAAFAQMRQRGANVTDIVVLVVAADDGVMPQTKESVKFCKNAGVPIIVAVNKMDKEGANPDRVKQELMEFELTPEEWGGETIYVPISAKTGDGIDNLLESIKLQAEIMELRESHKGNAEGIIIESKIETGRGPVSTILVQKGTLNKGDALVVGETYGRARNLIDFAGNNLDSAGPSTPVQVLGLNDVCTPGEQINVVKNEREAKKVVDNRVSERKQLEAADAPKVRSLDDFFADVKDEDKKVLNLVIRADVNGSYEAIKTAVESLGNDEVSVSVLGGGVGAITDNDVNLASNANGYIIGFNMRPITSARRLSEELGVEIKNYSIIYELIDDITLALEGMLEPEYSEKYIGRAEVRDTFNIPKVGVIAGSAVIDGKIERGCNIRLLRSGKIIHDGSLSSLKRFKDDVKEVKSGYECGISLENFNDVKVEDIFEAYILEKKARKLEPANLTL